METNETIKLSSNDNVEDNNVESVQQETSNTISTEVPVYTVNTNNKEVNTTIDYDMLKIDKRISLLSNTDLYKKFNLVNLDNVVIKLNKVLSAWLPLEATCDSIVKDFVASFTVE